MGGRQARPCDGMSRKTVKVCHNCGSDDIVKDAWASWNVEKQEWELEDFFDDTFCRACAQSYNWADERPVTEEELK